MGQQIIKQPNGKFAVFSSVVDGFTMTDATPVQLIHALVADETERITNRVLKVCDELNSGGRPYYQFTKTWDEALAEHIKNHGDLESTQGGKNDADNH